VSLVHTPPASDLNAKVRCERMAFDAAPVEIRVSRFAPDGALGELHITITPTRPAPVDIQLNWLEQAYRATLTASGTDGRSAVLRRLFASDPSNQAPALAASSLTNSGQGEDRCAESVIGQPPVGPAKVALWAMHWLDPAGALDKAGDGSTLQVNRGELTHHFTTGLAAPKVAGSHDQTRQLFDQYTDQLARHSMTLADHVTRTWLFVRDIDVNYGGLVKARRDLFERHGMTADTHYLASSGIQGQVADPNALVAMDAMAVAGLQPEQVRFVKATDHLSPTHVYGVTFERATRIAYRDRRHVIVSGTASIDHAGNVLHVGHVERQLDRTLENIAALLTEAQASLDDVNSWIVYLRDPSDQALLATRLEERLGHAPMIVVAAPVCRPTWLVEIECLATVAADHPHLPPL
jgi:enamine deaminase RidA (YjgF/YER057c/UK114 family)